MKEALFVNWSKRRRWLTASSMGRFPPAALLGDLDAAPERDVVLDLLRGLLRCRIVPGRILVLGSVDLEGVGRRVALPRAHTRRLAVFEILPLHRVGWEVMVPLDDAGRVAVGDDEVLPQSSVGVQSLTHLHARVWAAIGAPQYSRRQGPRTVKKPSCLNPECSFHGNVESSHIIRYGFYRTTAGKRRRYRCVGCGQTFSTTKGTPYYRLQHQAAAERGPAALC